MTPQEADYAYMRQRGASEPWIQDAIEVSGQPVVGIFSAQPAVYDDGPVYVAYETEGPEFSFEFLVGTDDNTSGGIGWDYLLDDLTGERLAIPLNHEVGYWVNQLPGFAGIGGRPPQLAMDPTDPTRIYVAYDDTDPCPCPPGETTDVEVYVSRLDKQQSGKWIAQPKVRVHEDADPGDTDQDQFKPVIAVDTQGWVHVTFYDDVMHGSQNRFDLHWAVSTNNGAGFRHSFPPAILPNQAVLDLVLDTNNPSPREYNGLDFWLDDQGKLAIWASYMGTHEDPAHFPETAIFAAFLEVTP